VLVYMLLCGDRPFLGDAKLKGIDHTYSVLNAIKRDPVNFEGQRWESVSVEAKEFVQGLLQKDPVKRTDVQEALNHKWLSRLARNSQTLDPTIL